MKKITLTALFLSLGLIARAGDNLHPKVGNLLSLENNFRNTVWYNSSNRAGLSFSPLNEYRTVNLKYDLEKGEYRSPERPTQIHGISLNTSGAVFLGKFLLCGDFSFKNRFEQGARYNTVSYEIEEDMPFYISDDYDSGWIKQEYDLDASLSSPVLADRVSLGLQVHYQTKVGAKQKDPRSETYKYYIEVLPSVVVRLGKDHYLGLNGLFQNSFERSRPSLNNYMEYPQIFYNKGLGEGLIGKVGGNDGLKTVFYKGMRYGGNLQYAYEKQATLLIDLQYLARKTDGFEHPNLPKRLGSTSSTDLSGRIQVLFGKHRSDRFSLHALYSSTDATEHIQKLNQEAFNQKWEIISSNRMSSYSRLSAELAYDHLFGNDDERGYDWTVGGDIRFSNRDYIYRIPLSTFTSSSTFFNVEGGKNFKFKKSSLLFTLNCGYNLSLGGEYKYGGRKKDVWQVTYYQKLHEYLTSDYIDAGARLAYNIQARKVSFFLNALVDWAKPLSTHKDRVICTASFGVLF